MIPFIEVTDANGNSGFIKADAIESLAVEAGTGITRIFVSTNGFYRVTNSHQEILTKLRDIESIKGLEGMN